MKPIAVVTTVANREDAHRLARTLVERKLAACAQISEIESIYHWQGEVQQAARTACVVQDDRRAYALVESTIRELHPYELRRSTPSPSSTSIRRMRSGSRRMRACWGEGPSLRSG